MSNERPSLEADGFGMWVDGKSIYMQVNRTPEQWKQWCAKAPLIAEQLAERIRAVAAEIEEIIARYDSFDLLANLMLPLAIRGEDAHEWDAPFPSAVIDYVALLALKDPYSKRNDIRPIDAGDIEQVLDLAQEAVYGILHRRALECVRVEGPTVLEEVRMRTFQHELLVRVPSYPQHEQEILLALFTPFDDQLVALGGVSMRAALAIAQGVDRMFVDGLGEFLDRIGTGRAEFRAMVEQARVRESDVPWIGEIAKLPEDERAKAIDWAAVTWAAYALDLHFGFEVDDLADASGISVNQTKAFLNIFSTPFGVMPPDFCEPTPTHPLRTRPLLHEDGRYLLADMYGLPWAIRPRLEELIRDSGDGRLWQRYQDNRGRWVQERSIRCIADCLGTDEAYAELTYTMPDGTRAELDGLALFDRTMFLVECKAGGFTESARRGAPGRLETDTKKLLGEAHAQALRAAEYIDSGDHPVFGVADGTHLVIDKARFQRRILVCVTLESVQPITTFLNGIARTGWIKDSDLPWALCLGDLMTIAEFVEFPEQLIHFIGRRLRVQEAGKVDTVDEVDYFAHYLAAGLYFEGPENEPFDRISILSHTEPMDMYFGVLGEHRRGGPPRQALPEGTRIAIRDIRQAGGLGFSEVVLSLIDWASDEQERLLSAWAATRLKTMRDGDIHNFTVTCAESSTGLTLAAAPRTRIVEVIARLDRYAKQKRSETGFDTWHCILSVPEWPGVAHLWLSDPE